MQLLDNLKWRYATKKFDTTKCVSDQDLQAIRQSIQLAATSYGLQLFKVLEIKDVALRGQLQTASWNQSQVTEASNLFVICSYTSVTEADIDAYISLKSDLQGIPVDALSSYADFMKSTILKQPTEAIKQWTAKQTYIILGTALDACAELKIDATPMEGFDPEAYDKILGLTEKGLTASLVLPVGYRSDEDQTQYGVKVRKSLEELFEEV